MAFKKAAVRFGVAESDYLLLKSMRIATFEQLAYRITKADDLEGFLRESVLPRAAFLEDDGEVVVFWRSPAESWEEFRLSEDAAAVRKLWAIAREVAKSEIEGLAASPDKPKAKVDLSSPRLWRWRKARSGMACLRQPPTPSARASSPSPRCRRSWFRLGRPTSTWPGRTTSAWRTHPCTFREVAEGQAGDHGRR